MCVGNGTQPSTRWRLGGHGSARGRVAAPLLAIASSLAAARPTAVGGAPGATLRGDGWLQVEVGHEATGSVLEAATELRPARRARAVRHEGEAAVEGINFTQIVAGKSCVNNALTMGPFAMPAECAARVLSTNGKCGQMFEHNKANGRCSCLAARSACSQSPAPDVVRYGLLGVRPTSAPTTGPRPATARTRGNATASVHAGNATRAGTGDFNKSSNATLACGTGGPEDPCTKDLVGTAKDVTASSEMVGAKAVNARMGSSAAWCAEVTDEKQWLQLSFDRLTEVRGIRTAGWRGSRAAPFTAGVKAFVLKFENASGDWWQYGEEELQGNAGADAAAERSLEPFNCSKIRICPTEWNTRICLRIEIIGRHVGPEILDPDSLKGETKEWFERIHLPKTTVDMVLVGFLMTSVVLFVAYGLLSDSIRHTMHSLGRQIAEKSMGHRGPAGPRSSSWPGHQSMRGPGI